VAKKKSRQDELFDRLRAGGLRKRAARTIARAGDKADSKRLRKAVEDLRGVLGELESRVGGVIGGDDKPKEQPAAAPKRAPARKPAARKPAARKPAATSRSAAAAKRSAAAKKAAATRAANRARAAKAAASSGQAGEQRASGQGPAPAKPAAKRSRRVAGQPKPSP
jgi:hypothetical protein